MNSVLSATRKSEHEAPTVHVPDQPAEAERVQLHWLVTGGLLSGAMWAVVIALVMAVAGAGTKALYPLLVAVSLLGILGMCVRRARSLR